jgi:negative regulator of flagellin synthesis FlgM
MKINGTRDGLRPEPLNGSHSAPRPGTSGVAASKPVGGEVQLSDLSSALAQLGSRLAAEGEFDPAAVERIKGAIANGEYHVNADAVADKLLHNVRELLEGKV